jgi:hypothetical protein
MKRIICFFLLSLFLFSCSSAGASLETTANTSAPSTAIPAITLTPTITPTVTPEITDIPAWLDERTQYWVGKLGYGSYEELVQDKVMKNYIDSYNGLAYPVGLPYGIKTSQGFVLERKFLQVDGVDKLCALVAFSNSSQLGCVELGYKDKGTFVPLVTNLYEVSSPDDYDPKVKFNSPDSYGLLDNKLWTFRIFSGAEQPQVGNGYSNLIASKDMNPSYRVAYRDQIKMRGQWADEFWAAVTDPNGSQLTAYKYLIDNYDAVPTEYGRESGMNGGASMVWILDKIGSNNQFILIDRLSASDQDGEKVRTW